MKTLHDLLKFAEEHGLPLDTEVRVYDGLITLIKDYPGATPLLAAVRLSTSLDVDDGVQEIVSVAKDSRSIVLEARC